MKMIDRYRVARWSLLVTARRLANRWWDLVGYAAGFCMATTWREADQTYGRGMRHWRCGYLRKAHRSDGSHRFGDFLWSDQDAPFIRRSVRTGVDMVGAGELPRWLRGRHYSVGTRRRDRLAMRAAFDRIRAGMREAAAKLAEQPIANPAAVEQLPVGFESVQDAINRATERFAAVTGAIEVDEVRIGGVPFMGAGTVRLGEGYRVDAAGNVVRKSPEALRSWASRPAPTSDQHDSHVHKGREFLFGATIDNPGTVREEAAAAAHCGPKPDGGWVCEPWQCDRPNECLIPADDKTESEGPQ